MNRNESHDMDMQVNMDYMLQQMHIQRLLQHREQTEEAQQTQNVLQNAKEQELLLQLQHQECPIVWRWVPSHAQEQHDIASTSLRQPRIIFATAQRTATNNTNLNDLPPLLTGGELREAREVLNRNNEVDSLMKSATSSSASKLPLRIPEVPTNVPPHVNLVRQRFLQDPNVHCMPVESQDTNGNGNSNSSGSGNANPNPNAVSPTMAPETNTGSASGAAGGELEVANLLLNMGGSSPKPSTVIKKKKQPANGRKSGSPSRPKGQAAKSTATSTPASTTKSSNRDDVYLEKWVAGSVSLHTPEDDDVLSPLHCFMRRYCVEAFSATPEDVATPRYGKSHGFKVEVGQVGIRCLHCRDLTASNRAERAVCYPSSLRNIYHSIETWQRRHSLVCKRIDPWVRKSILELMESSKSRAGGRRQYWEDSARRLGMVDTSQGVRFCRKPGDLGPMPSLGSGRVLGAPDAPQYNPEEIVRPDDKDLVTDYLFLLMDQMQTCRFTEEDRTGGRSKIKDNQVGFPGMECRHCQGRAGFGRYFPSSVAALSLANSDRNVYNHLQKCRKCPKPVKIELVRLQKDQAQSKNRRGLRKLFFNRIWKRMHAVTEKDKDDKSEALYPTGLVSVARKPSPEIPSEFVVYNGMVRPMPRLQPAIMGHSYQHSLHPQVTVNNFRRY